LLKAAAEWRAPASPAGTEAPGDEECGQDPEPGQERGDPEDLVKPAVQRRR